MTVCRCSTTEARRPENRHCIYNWTSIPHLACGRAHLYSSTVNIKISRWVNKTFLRSCHTVSVSPTSWGDQRKHRLWDESSLWSAYLSALNPSSEDRPRICQRSRCSKAPPTATSRIPYYYLKSSRPLDVLKELFEPEKLLFLHFIFSLNPGNVPSPLAKSIEIKKIWCLKPPPWENYVCTFFFPNKHYLSVDFVPANLVGTENKEINKTQGLLSRVSKVVMEKGRMGPSAMEQSTLDWLERKSFTRPRQSALPTALWTVPNGANIHRQNLSGEDHCQAMLRLLGIPAIFEQLSAGRRLIMSPADSSVMASFLSANSKILCFFEPGPFMKGQTSLHSGSAPGWAKALGFGSICHGMPGSFKLWVPRRWSQDIQHPVRPLYFCINA
jgi:hypothetical protein